MRHQPVLEKAVVARIMAALKNSPHVVVRKRHGTAMGVAGDPDLYGTINGRHFEIEVKRPNDSSSQLTKLQDDAPPRMEGGGRDHRRGALCGRGAHDPGPQPPDRSGSARMPRVPVAGRRPPARCPNCGHLHFDQEAVVIYGSVCSGIEAATVAWQPLGLAPRVVRGDRQFASAVLAHRFPEVQNLGDFTTIDPARTDQLTFSWEEPPASPSPSPATGLDWMTLVATSRWSFSDWLRASTPLARLGKRPRRPVDRRRTDVWNRPRDAGRPRVWDRLPGSGRSVLRSAPAPPSRLRCWMSWRVAGCRCGTF